MSRIASIGADSAVTRSLAEMMLALDLAYSRRVHAESNRELLITRGLRLDDLICPVDVSYTDYDRPQHIRREPNLPPKTLPRRRFDLRSVNRNR